MTIGITRAIVFMISLSLSFIISIISHELAHFTAAVLLRIKVHDIQIGPGRNTKGCKIFEIKNVPCYFHYEVWKGAKCTIGENVLTELKTAPRIFLLYGAGVLLNLIVAVISFSLISLTQNFFIGIILLANLLLGVNNALPYGKDGAIIFLAVSALRRDEPLPEYIREKLPDMWTAKKRRLWCIVAGVIDVIIAMAILPFILMKARF